MCAGGTEPLAPQLPFTRLQKRIGKRVLVVEADRMDVGPRQQKMTSAVCAA